MKRFGWFFAMAFGVSILAFAGELVAGPSCCAIDAMANQKAQAAKSREGTSPSERTVVFRVDGMTCGGCAAGVEGSLGDLAGVKEVMVSYEDSRAILTIQEEKVTTEELQTAIEKTGYKAAFIPTEDVCIRVEGLVNEKGASLLESKLSTVEGIHQASVHPQSGVLCLIRTLGKALDSDLLKAVENAGDDRFEFKAKIMPREEPTNPRKEKEGE